MEGSTAEAHEERPDGGVWEHPHFWLGLVVVGSVITAAFFLLRFLDLLTAAS
ncbi:substrate-specific component RibU of riboflavin ECF transporter [Streptomyces sp. OM5714]|nr:substrate-specific component RibU of riboflavin ECF transporter [Streptomyces sp. OM5714]